MQLRDFQTCRTSESRQSFSLLSLSASSSALTLPRNSATFSSSSFSLDRFQPLRGNTSPSTGETLLPPPADDCLIPGLDDPNTAVRCEPFPGSESSCSLPACATVRAVLSAGPSGAPNWVGFQDLYDTARGIFDLCNARDPGGGRSVQSGRPSRSCKYSESGDLLCTDGNPAYVLLPLPLQAWVAARCLESLRFQFRRAVHDRTMCADPEGLVYLGVIV